jgi:hypothetical protein
MTGGDALKAAQPVQTPLGAKTRLIDRQIGDLVTIRPITWDIDGRRSTATPEDLCLLSPVGERMQKVFCIGFHKTGTTSMRDALALLGYRVTGPNGLYDPEIAIKLDALVDTLSESFDAFQDNPWPLVYRRMDEKYPDAKFILTVRDPDRWSASVVRHFQQQETPMRALIYGGDAATPTGNEAHYIAVMTRHNAEVLEYFRDRPGKLLVMDLSRGHGWRELCAFLGLDVPDAPFPHANAANDREKFVARATRFARRHLASLRRLLRMKRA